MSIKPIPDEAEIAAIAGHAFPGGTYSIEHWENFLLSECAGAELLPNGIVHPVALFHVPIIGAGTSIAEMFALGQAESDLSIMIESYDWEIFEPLKEDVPYAVSGKVISAERCSSDEDRIYDRLQFCFEIRSPGQVLTARTTITWHYTRNTL
ncbi:MAG: hypothetical protein ACR2P1_02540 [Pseudomonadales bacterium]